ncbi:hypothetical protein [Hyphomicrobium sp. 99]|uniref:hypothetical protein n=1 Tax=Hyphomicrobium sp. 99 TaxID=1163419 RepID=UPI0005F7831F|nr:hypothetical protein [Hyphomicrobium sp. 99]
MTLVIVFIGAICYYYFGAIGAVLGALVITSSLSKSRADAILPSLAFIAFSWAAGNVIASNAGAAAGVIFATAVALWFEGGNKPRHHRPAIDKH